MDVALTVAELRHDDARRPEGRRGHARRDSRRTSWCTTSTSGAASTTKPTETSGRTRERRPARDRRPRRLLRHARRRSRACPSRWAPRPIAVIGRNGMGKTTLCNSIMGIEPPRRAADRSGSAASSCSGKPSYKIAGAGIAYVPQGRRLFQSLSTDEHLKMIGRERARALERRPRSTTSSRDSPSASGQRDAALRRGAADARDRPGAADEPGAADHGRALRRARTDDRGTGDRDLPRTRARREWRSCSSSRTSASRPRSLTRQLVMVAGRIAAETTAEALDDRLRRPAALSRRRAARPDRLTRDTPAPVW